MLYLTSSGSKDYLANAKRGPGLVVASGLGDN